MGMRVTGENSVRRDVQEEKPASVIVKGLGVKVQDTKPDVIFFELTFTKEGAKTRSPLVVNLQKLVDDLTPYKKLPAPDKPTTSE